MSQIMNDKKKLVFEDILTIPGKKVNRGQIIIRGEFVHVSHYTTQFQMRWENLNNRIPRIWDICYHIQPIRFQISRRIPNSENFALVYMSPLFFNTQHPVNTSQQIALQVLCNSDMDRPLKFAAINAKDQEINSVITTVNRLKENKILTGGFGAKFAL